MIPTSHSQTDKSREKNAEFFLTNLEGYSVHVGTIDTYQRISAVLTRELAGIDSLLDIGNGGVFDYDTSVVGDITGLDLFLDKLPAGLRLPSNVRMEAGDALSVPKPDNSFDGVVMVMLLHHLVGETVAQCIANVERAISEAHRVLKPGGKFVLIESCVPHWFYRFEQVVYRVAAPLIGRLLTHPATLQYTAPHIAGMIQRAFGQAPSIDHIPKGRYVLQFGLKVPSQLTPVEPYLFTANRAH